MLKIRIAFVHNYCIHYRIPLFLNLLRYFDVDFYFAGVYRTVKRIPQRLKRKSYILRSIMPIVFSPMLIIHLLRKRYDVYIAGDIQTVNTWITFIIAKILRRPFILWEERWFLTKRSRYFWPFMKLIYSKADAVIVPGKKAYQFAVLCRSKKNGVFIAPNASMLTITNRVLEKALNLKQTLFKDKFVILYFGRLEELKGLKYLIKAFAELEREYNNVSLLIVGDGTLKEELKDLIIQLRVKNAHLIGHYVEEEEERALYFLISDVVVYPSIKETWGLLINEAISVGKPVITTYTTAAAHDPITDGVNGLIIPPRSIEYLKRALIEIMRNYGKISHSSKKKAMILIKKYNYISQTKGFIDAVHYLFKNKKIQHKH